MTKIVVDSPIRGHTEKKMQPQQCDRTCWVDGARWINAGFPVAVHTAEQMYLASPDKYGGSNPSHRFCLLVPMAVDPQVTFVKA